MDEKHLSENINVTEFCRNSNCSEYIEWDFDYGTCYSCQLVGQSCIVDTIPANCIKKEEILSWLNEGNGELL